MTSTMCVVRVLGALLAAACWAGAASGQYAPRNYYGAPLEPVDKIFHGAGQTYRSEPLNHAFENYGAMMGDTMYPVVFMDYNSINSSLGFYQNLKTRLEQIEADTGKYVIPQFGFYIPSAGMPDGQYEAQLQRMADGLNLLDRPCYMRIGYEFNGVWYDPLYQPTSFKHAFRRVVDKLRAEEVEAVSVWNPYPGWHSYYGSWNYMSQFYPGDDYVDWFGMDLFSASDINSPHTATLIQQADAHGKPMLIGEATPRYIGADQASDWNAWYQPFFNLIRNNPGIKGHAYINWDWGLTTEWSNWGNADLTQGHAFVRENYIAEMTDPIWAHATGERQSWMVIPEPATWLGVLLLVPFFGRRRAA